jgi:ACS family hexuronate transporter-like MFS transporter
VGERRWRIALLIAAAIAISYFDRQTLPVAIQAIQREIPVTNFQFGQLNLAFLLAYGAMYAAGGKLIDILGTRKGFFLIMVWWSLACASHGLAAGFAMLAASRLLLGMGEGGGFPAATKAVAEFFPAAERSTAMGVINAGTAVGAVIAPPGIALVIGTLGWRWVFFISGAMGLAWAYWWGRAMPAECTANAPLRSRLGLEESGTDAPLRSRLGLEVARDGREGSLTWECTANAPLRSRLGLGVARGGREGSLTWFQLLRNRQVRGLVSAKFLSDAAWFVYMSWLAKYLYDVRGFDTAQAGYFAWIPFAAAGAGSLSGGWFSSRLIRSGRSLDFSRKLTLGASAALMPWIFFVTHAPVQWAIVLFALAFFGQQSWSALVMTVPADIFPGAAVGSVAGLVGMGGALGGAVFNLLVGYMLDHKMGYGAVFGMLSTFHVIAFAIILLVVGRIRPLETT